MHWVHKDVNVMKNGYEFQYFIQMCHLVAENNPKPEELVVTSFVFGNELV